MRHLLSLAILLFVSTTWADAEFSTGPVFADYGAVVAVDATMTIPPGTKFKHSFDVFDAAADGSPNTGFVTAARFINMHARAGVPVDDIELAIVVHGGAAREVAGEDSASADLIAALIDQGVRIIVCGQSAAYRGVAVEDLSLIHI